MSLDAISLIHLLIAIISLGIALIALRGYLMVRKRRLLLLSAAFLLLSIPQTIAFLINTDIFPGLGDQLGFCKGPYLLILSIASIAAFALLAYIYNYQRKSQAIRITRAQWAMGGLLILAEVGYIAYIIFAYGHFLLDFGAEDFYEVLYLILGSVAYLLIVLTVISLFSYYRAKRTRCTLVVMFGFILFLVSQLVVGFFALIHLLLGLNLFSSALVTSIELVGYMAFLLALVRPRFLR